MEEVGGFVKTFSLEGSKGGTKVAWAMWDNVCKAKKTSDLRVKDLRCVNLTLLSGGGGFFLTCLRFELMLPMRGMVLRVLTSLWKARWEDFIGCLISGKTSLSFDLRRIRSLSGLPHRVLSSSRKATRPGFGMMFG